MRLRTENFQSIFELEDRMSELNYIIKKYDSGDRESNKKYSSSAMQRLEDERRTIDHYIWKIKDYKERGIGSRYINADLSDLENEKSISSDLVITMVENSSLNSAVKKEDVKTKKINALDFLEKYITDGRCVKDGLSLTFSGPTGTGKTHFAAATMLTLMDKYPKGLSFHFIQMSDLVSLLLDKNYKSSDKFNKIREVDFLVIDDMAAEKTWLNAIEEIMQRVFRYRYNNNLPIISTTNLNLFDFVAYYGERHKSVFCSSDTHRSLYFINKKDVRIK